MHCNAYNYWNISVYSVQPPLPMRHDNSLLNAGHSSLLNLSLYFQLLKIFHSDQLPVYHFF